MVRISNSLDYFVRTFKNRTPFENQAPSTIPNPNTFGIQTLSVFFTGLNQLPTPDPGHAASPHPLHNIPGTEAGVPPSGTASLPIGTSTTISLSTENTTRGHTEAAEATTAVVVVTMEVVGVTTNAGVAMKALGMLTDPREISSPTT